MKNGGKIISLSPGKQEGLTEAPSIHLERLCLNYDAGCILHEIEGEFAPNSLTAIVGPNGAGKTTLLKAILGMLPIHAGNIGIKNCAAQQIGYLPQLNEFDRKFPLSVYDLVAMGLWAETGLLRGIDGAQERRISAVLEEIGLKNYERKLIGSLSTGQLKRALFARIMLQNPKLILLDEPFAALDEDTASFLMSKIHAWHREGKTILAVVHDIGKVSAEFPETLLLARRQIAWGKTGNVLSKDRIFEAYQTLEQFSA